MIQCDLAMYLLDLLNDGLFLNQHWSLRRQERPYKINDIVRSDVIIAE